MSHTLFRRLGRRQLSESRKTLLMLWRPEKQLSEHNEAVSHHIELEFWLYG